MSYAIDLSGRVAAVTGRFIVIGRHVAAVPAPRRSAVKLYNVHR